MICVPIVGIIAVTQNKSIICDGRVKTLHPNVHGGLLARRDDESYAPNGSNLDALRDKCKAAAAKVEVY